MKATVIVFIISLLISCSSDNNVTSAVDKNDGPSGLTLERLSPTSVKISWRDNSDSEDFFVVHRKADNEDWISEYKRVDANSTSLVDSLIDWTYDKVWYKVEVSKDQEYFGSETNQAGIQISSTAPDSLKAVLSENSILLSWVDNSDGEDGFYLDKYVSGTGWIEEYASITSNTTDYEDTDVSKWGKYRLYARHKDIKSIETSSACSVDSLPHTDTDISVTFFTSAAIFDNFLILNADRKIEIYEITNPKSPVKFGEYGAHCMDYCTKIQISNNLAYCAFSDSLVILDVSNPESPEFESKLELNDLKDFVIQDQYGYAADKNGLNIISFEETAAPDIIEIIDYYNGGRLEMQDGMLFMFDMEDGLTIVNCLNPEQCKIMTNFNPDCDFLSNSLLVNGQTVYLSNRIVDAVNKSNPILLDIILPVSQNLYRSGNKLFCSGISIFDALVPEKPVMITDSGSYRSKVLFYNDYVILVDHSIHVYDFSQLKI